ncbi:MAG: FtsX-like permease family protein [Anaerolineae bacterium]|nr:FtsX-like permease family protein [Anaerolineae bacterium]
MKVLFRTWAIFVVAIRRLLSQKGLNLATLLGLVVAIALALSIPLYADAVYYRIFRKELQEATTSGGYDTGRSPFAFMFRYVGSWQGAVDWADVQPVDQYFSTSVPALLGLPKQISVRYIKTDNFRVFPEEEIAYADTRDPLTWAYFGFVDGIENHITILEGNFPAVAESTANSTVEVLISEALATELGLQVGETYMTFSKQVIDGAEYTTQIPIRITGVWRETDPADPFWFYRPNALEALLLVPPETFLGRIDPYMEKSIYLAMWYLVMDGSDVHAADALPLLSRMTFLEQKTGALLPGVTLDVSPKSALQNYYKASSQLTVLLYIFAVPILVLILTFVNLVVGLAVGRKHNEIAVLRSRGATAVQVIGISLVEGLILGGLALVIGLPLGEEIAEVIGQTRSFLDFSAQSELRVAATKTTLQIGVVAVALALMAQVVPTIGAARHTIVTYKQERARTLRPPWWQRAWLDLLLLIPAVYGTYLLQQQGSVVVPTGEEAVVNDPFQNPLLFLVPALGIFAFTLFFIRILPLVMSMLAWFFSHIGGVGILLATRQLARSPGLYTAPMLLLVLTLSLSVFTASLAQTLDNHLFDQMYYKVGADIGLADYGESAEDSTSLFSLPTEAADGEEVVEEDSGPQWLFLPVTQYLEAPGVLEATRVGKFKAFTQLSGGNQEGVMIGIDRVDFSRVAFWRWDFAPSSLGEMTNALALARDGVLLPREFMAAYRLKVGDTVRINVTFYGTRLDLDMRIVGGFDYFPTWYEEQDGPLFVANLDYLFEEAGGQFPYDVWLRIEPQTSFEQLKADIVGLGYKVLNWDVALEDIFEEQQNPGRQGLFGLLSVGFGAAALFTILGFLLYALFSFRQRFIELGVLRAIGLSAGQMAVFLAWELAFLILSGLVLGTGLGILVSDLFIPYLQIGADAVSLTPPFLVEIAWPAIFRIYTIFGLLFFAALLILTVLLLRMRIFEAVKLGETV